ncbi:VOC family protein [Paenibacillus lupini]|uniref:VOC family protein n=1 Tax=Paenibacillus lupini TaxID=1450204 RepID=UPI00141D909D|nr:VOC family protein [Paenibacillus lupini]NIK26047.1 catechol 2,3-dioxygenase-like lactoylglutathione lyase family enzyme [Paenibacillus lupini]
MKLNHLNLCVIDLSEAILFFQTVFDFKLTDQKGNAIAVMNDSHGFTLVLSSMRSGENGYPKDFHLGFYVDTTSEVDQFYQKLGELGMASEQTPGMMRGGYTLYFTALGGILFEVTCLNP